MSCTSARNIIKLQCCIINTSNYKPAVTIWNIMIYAVHYHLSYVDIYEKYIIVLP